MENEENTGLESVDTGATGEENVSTTTETLENEGKVEEKLYNQSQINEMIRQRLDRDRKSFYSKYGVEDEKGFERIVSKAKLYDDSLDTWHNRVTEHNALVDAYNELSQNYAFLKNNVDESKYDDVKIFFKGKEISLNDKNLAAEIATHPEWLRKEKVDLAPKTTISKLGLEQKGPSSLTEKEIAYKYL